MAGEPAPAAPPPLATDGDKIAIRSTDGRVTLIHKDDLSKAQSEGYVPATETELKSAQLGVGGEVAAGLAGAAQGATFNLGLPAVIGATKALGATEAAEQMRRGLRIVKETSPDAYTTGNIAGSLLPLAFGVPPAAAGEEIGGTLLGRAAGRAVEAAPRALGEGAAFGVGEQATEDAIDNHPFAAEAYVKSAFKGGAIGLLAGTVGAAGIGAASDKAALIFGRKAEPAAGAAETIIARRRATVLDPNAGLTDAGEAIEKPFTFGKTTHEVGFDPGGLDADFATAVPNGRPVARRGFLDKDLETVPDASDPAARDWFLKGRDLPAPEGEPEPFMRAGKLPKLRGEADDLGGDVTAPVWSRQPREPGAFATEQGPIGTRFGIDPNAGLREGEAAEGGLFGIAPNKTPRPVGFRGLDVGAETEPRYRNTGSAFGSEAMPEEAAAVGAAGPKTFAQKIDDAGARQAFHATGAKTAAIRRLGADAPSQDETILRMGRRLTGDTLEDGTPLLGPLTSHAEIASNVTRKTAEIAKQIRPVYEALNKAKARPALDTIASRFDAEVRQPLLKTLYGDRELGVAEDTLERLAKQAGDRPSFTELWEHQKQIDKELRRAYARPRDNALPVPPGEEALQKLRGIVHDELMSSAERASTELGGTLIDKLKLLNASYGDFRTLKSILTNEAALRSASSRWSITDAIAAARGGVAGAAMGAANYVRRHYGPQMAAHVLGTTAKLMGVQRAAAEVDSVISRSAREFIEGKGSSVAARPAKITTAEEIRSLRDAVRSPDTVRERIAAGLGDLPKYAPKLAGIVSTRIAINAAYLRDHLPKEPPPVGLSWNRVQRPLSDTERQKAGQMIETIEDPTIVLDRLLEGRLTRTHVETLKATNPEIYDRTVKYINSHGEELRATLTMQQQAAIGLLFGEPVNEAFLPANIKAFQASLTGGSQAPGKAGAGGNEGGAAPGAKPINLKDPGGTHATETDKLEKGDS